MIKLKSLLEENVYEYFYHATTPNALPNIVNRGLMPSENTNWGGDLGKFSEGKIFVTKKFRTANYYGNIIWRNNSNRYRPILRFKYNKLRFIPDKRSTDDFYVEFTLKARFEMFVYNENTKIETEHNGDMWFNEHTGHWRPLTKELSESISTGEWDGEEPENYEDLKEIEYPLAKKGELQSYEGMADWKGKIVWMSPDKFLSLVLPLNYPEVDKLKKVTKRLRRNLPIDFLVLKVNAEENRVVGHEGRHRALVSKKLGIEKVPVLVYFAEYNDAYPRVPKWTQQQHDYADKAEFERERPQE
jgi:hypothetical protein